jgi:threonine/homoserine/homoserine lactone efflux protein
VFLGLLLTAVNSRNLGQAAAQFISYSLGMGAVLVAVTLGAALSGGAVARALRRLTPHVHRFSAFFLVGAGLYLLYYWGVYARSV